MAFKTYTPGESHEVVITVAAFTDNVPLGAKPDVTVQKRVRGDRSETTSSRELTSPIGTYRESVSMQITTSI